MNINIGDKFKNYQETEYKILSLEGDIIEVEVTNYNGVKNIWKPDIEYFTKCNLVKLPKHKINDKFVIIDDNEEWEIKDIIYSMKDKIFYYQVVNKSVDGNMTLSQIQLDNPDSILFGDKIKWCK